LILTILILHKQIEFFVENRTFSFIIV